MNWINKGSSSIGLLIMLLLIITFSFSLVNGGLSNDAYYNSTGGTGGTGGIGNGTFGQGIGGGGVGGGGTTTRPLRGSDQIIVTTTLAPGQKNLQLRTFTVITVTPSPTIAPSPSPLATQPPQSCSTATTETMIVIDHSSTMEGQKLAKAKAAANSFLDIIGVTVNNRAGLSIFDEIGELYSGLTPNLLYVKSRINQIPESSGTCIQCGLKLANDEIRTNGRAGIDKNVILLSDGRANHVDGRDVSDSTAVAAALAEVRKGFSESGTRYFTIGFGSDVNTSFMQQTASETGGTYAFSPTENELAAIFAQIAQAICQ